MSQRAETDGGSHWRDVVVLAQGPVWYTLGLFIKPLNQEFGWDRASISAAGGIARDLFRDHHPFVGSLMDRWGVRANFVVVLCLSVALIALLQNQPSCAVCDHWRPGIGPGALGMQNAFRLVRRQARPLGITMSGSVWERRVVYTQFLIGNFGWLSPISVSACSR